MSGIEGGELDPRAAATLLEQTKRQAQRRFDVGPPLLTTSAAVVVLVAYGAVWFSVRHQHPYTGPSLRAIAVLYGTLIPWFVLVAVVTRRATSGVGGRSSTQRKADGIVFATIWTFVYVFQGALHHAGASHAIAYGIYPAAAPLVIVGSAAAAYQVGRREFGWVPYSLAVVVLAGLASFAGPARVWGIVGVGLCALLLCRTAMQLRLRRA